MDDNALYSAIMEQHEALKEDMARLRSTASGPQGVPDEGWRADMRDQAAELRECLRKHFELEEVGGYLEPVLEKRPGLGRSVCRLHNQHGEILIELDSVDDACRKEAPVAEIGNLALRVLDLLRQHEAEESDLIQGALGDDLAGGD